MFKEFYEKIENNQQKIENFENFKNLILEYNKMFNITAITDEREIYIKHFYDSLFGKDYIKEGDKIIEIGSGGGFPSVPLKIYNPDFDFTLCESVGKKCKFLNVVKEKLNFENFEVLNVRCEDIAKDEKYREKYDVVIGRGVAYLNTLCEYMLPFLKVGGLMIAYKGEGLQEIEDSKNAIEILGGKLEEIVDYSLIDNLGKRKLILIRKIKNTPSKYPRGKNKERKEPL